MRRVSIAFAIAAALLVLSAQPVAALQTNTVIGGQHTTDTDFNGATTLENVSVSGSGSAAFVSLPGGEVLHEDGSLGEFGGDAGSFSTTTSTVNNGTYAVEGDLDPAGFSIISSTDQTISNDGNFSVFLYPSTAGGDRGQGGFLFGTQNEGGASSISGYSVYVDENSELIQINRWDSGTRNVLVQKSGLGYASDQWLRVNVNWTGSDISAEFFNAAGTEVGSLTVTDSTYSSGGLGYVVVDHIIVDHEATASATKGTYVSQTHSVDNAVTGKTNLSLTDAEAHVSWLADTNGDGTFETTAASATYTTSGNKSLDISGTTSTDWRVNVTLVNTSAGGSPTAELHDETILFENHQPAIDNATASPTGDLSTAAQTLSIQVNDTEFATAQGDSVTATFEVDGTTVGTDTLTSNGSASTSHTFGGGTHTWNVSIDDSYGLANTSQTFTVSSPANLSIRDELAPDTLVTDAQVNITAYYSGHVERRTTSNGNISLSGFPTDEPITVRANASGYYTRTAVIEDIYEQSSMYLLNESTATYLVRFDLQDPTGSFPREDTVLFVERDLNRSGSVEWRIIAGDNFGVQGVPVNLEQDERYRLRIKNLETGSLNVIGAYTAIQSETVTISAGSATVDVASSEREYAWTAIENETGQYILIEYLDEASETTSIKVTVHERFNESNVLVDNTTFSTNDLSYNIPLTADQTNRTWMAELYIDRGDGYQHFRVPVGSGPRAILPSNLDPVLVTGVGVFVLLVVAMAFSELNQGVGAIVTSLVGGALWYFGVLTGTATAAAIGVALAISIVYNYQQGGVGA